MKNKKNIQGFLVNKFCVPENSTSTVPRKQLFEKMNEIKVNKWCTISAPTGFGKTSLVVSWLPTQKLIPVWVTLECSDNQIKDFWVALVNAFAVKGYVTNTYVILRSYSNDDIGSYEWINHFFNEICLLAIDKNQEAVLVLDDMHNIDNQDVISAIARLLRFLPSELSVVLISRETMPNAIKSLNIGNTSAEFTAQELSFTSDQCLAYSKLFIEQYADKIHDPHLRTSLNEKIENIWYETDGWPVFVCLTIHFWLDHIIHAENESNLFVQDNIWRYLEQHIYDHLSDDMKECLIGVAPYIAVNEAFYQQCLDLPVKFSKLLETNGLLTTHKDIAGFVRVRKPLRQFLYSLRLEEDQDKQTKKFEIAYQWYIEHKMIIEAILLSLERTHWLVAIDLIEKESEYLLTSGRCSEICAPFDLIPESYIIDRPALLIFMARYFYHQITHKKVTRYVNQAESAISDDKPNNSSVGKYTHRSKEQLLTDISQLKFWVGGLLNESSGGYNPSKSEISPECSNDKISAGLMCGLYYLSIGKIPKAQDLLESSLKKALAGDHHTVSSKSLIALGWVCYLSGDFARLHTILGSVKATLTNPGSANYTVAHQSNWIMALTLLEQGKISQAECLLQESAFHKNMKDAPLDVKFESLMMQVITSIELNQFEEADKLFEHLDILSFELPSVVQQCFFSIPALKAEMYLKQGCLEKAIIWIERLACLDDAKNTITHQHESLVKANVLIARGNLDEALHNLVFLKKIAQKSGNQIILMKAYIAESIAYQSRQNEEKSLISFHHAIETGKQMGSAQSFLRDNVQLTCLLKRAKVAFHHPAYIGRLLAERNVEESSAHPDMSSLAALSKREREVLELMATGISNPQIAESLCRSLGTIKIHAHNIYKKLGVSNRVKAISKYLTVLPSLNEAKAPQKSIQFDSIH